MMGTKFMPVRSTQRPGSPAIFESGIYAPTPANPAQPDLSRKDHAALLSPRRRYWRLFERKRLGKGKFHATVRFDFHFGGGKYCNYRACSGSGGAGRAGRAAE